MLDKTQLDEHVQSLNICPTQRRNQMSATSLLGVLRLLDASPVRSQREVASELGMSLGTANYLLRALLDKGFVKVQNFRSSSNKRAYAYLITPAGVAAKAELTRQFLARKIEEYEALQVEIERLRSESKNDSAIQTS